MSGPEMWHAEALCGDHIGRKVRVSLLGAEKPITGELTSVRHGSRFGGYRDVFLEVMAGPIEYTLTVPRRSEVVFA
jgi:hypothetical protein